MPKHILPPVEPMNDDWKAKTYNTFFNMAIDKFMLLKYPLLNVSNREILKEEIQPNKVVRLPKDYSSYALAFVLAACMAFVVAILVTVL